MIKICELGSLPNLPAAAPLRQAAFWGAEVETLEPEQVVAFVKRMELQGRGSEALSNVDTLIHTLIKYVTRHEIDGERTARMKLRERRLSIDEIKQLLTPMSDRRRDAVIFALGAGLTPSEVIVLRHRDVRRLSLDQNADRVYANHPRHIRTDYVFWEYVEGRLSPLISLTEHVELVIGEPWWWLKDAYAQALPIDFEADSCLFRRAVDRAILQ